MAFHIKLSQYIAKLAEINRYSVLNNVSLTDEIRAMIKVKLPENEYYKKAIIEKQEKTTEIVDTKIKSNEEKQREEREEAKEEARIAEQEEQIRRDEEKKEEAIIADELKAKQMKDARIAAELKAKQMEYAQIAEKKRIQREKDELELQNAAIEAAEKVKEDERIKLENQKKIDREQFSEAALKIDSLITTQTISTNNTSNSTRHKLGKIIKAEFNSTDATGSISKLYKGYLKELYLTMAILMKQPVPFIIFGKVYNNNNNSEKEKLFISTNNLHKNIGKSIKKTKFNDYIKKFIVREKNGEDKILIHLLLKILYKNYIPYEKEYLKVEEETLTKLYDYYNFIIGKLNTYSITEESTAQVKTLINRTNETNAKLGNIDLSIKIRQGMGVDLEPLVNSRVEILQETDNFQINWNAKPTEINYKSKYGTDRTLYENDFDKDKFRGESKVFPHEYKAGQIAEEFYKIGFNEDKVEIYFLSGQSGSGKTFTTLGNEDNPDAGFVLKMLKNYYKPKTIDIIVGEIFEEQSDKFLNYQKTGEKFSTNFRPITTEKIVQRIDDTNRANDTIAKFVFDEVLQDWKYENISMADFLITSLKIRSVLPTTNNAESSRSHVIIHMVFEYMKDGESVEKKIFIIDAAGVENEFKCGTTYFEERFKAKARTVAKNGWLRGTLSSILTPEIKEDYNYQNLVERKFKLQTGGDLPKKFPELELAMMDRKTLKEKGELAKNFTPDMACAPPGPELNEAKPFKYLKKEREKLEEHISTLVASIFTWNQTMECEEDIDKYYDPEKNYGDKERVSLTFAFNKTAVVVSSDSESDDESLDTPKKNAKAQMKFIEEFKKTKAQKEALENMLNIPFKKITRDFGQKLARQWLKTKLDNYTKDNKNAPGLKLLEKLLNPNGIKYKIAMGTVSGKGYGNVKRYIGDSFEYGTDSFLSDDKGNSDIVDALTLLITLINQDLELDNKKCVIKGSTLKIPLKSPIINAIIFKPIYEKMNLDEIINIKGKNFFELDDPKLTVFGQLLWKVIKINPDLPTTYQCTESLKKAFEELCKNMVLQGYMINSELRKLKNVVRGTGKTLPILPFMLSNGILAEAEVESSRFLDPKNYMKVDDLIETSFSPSSAKTDDEVIDSDKKSWIMDGLLKLYNETKTKDEDIVEMNQFLNMIKIHIILVINITRIDFGGLLPNNPPTPAFVQLELLINIIHDIKFKKEVDFLKFAQILAFILTDINKYEEYQDLAELLEVLENFTGGKFDALSKETNVDNRKWGDFFSTLDLMIKHIENNNAATLIGNSYEMYKMFCIEPVTYEMSKNKQKEYETFEDLNVVQVQEKIKELYYVVEKKIKEKKAAILAAKAKAKLEAAAALVAQTKAAEHLNTKRIEMTVKIKTIINQFEGKVKVNDWSMEGEKKNRDEITEKLKDELPKIVGMNLVKLNEYDINSGGLRKLSQLGRDRFPKGDDFINAIHKLLYFPKSEKSAKRTKKKGKKRTKRTTKNYRKDFQGGKKQKKRKTKRKRKKKYKKKTRKKH